MTTTLRAVLATDGTAMPPTADLLMVRNEHRRLTGVVTGIPSGVTLAKLVWTGKTADTDADTAKRFQKVLTTTSALASIGQITDAGASGTARWTASFVPGDSANWPAAVQHQLWAVLSDNKTYCVLEGTVTSLAPIPLAMPSAVNPNLPPAAQDALVLAWDAKRGTVLGPAWQNGSTAGADTNDATYVAGPPERYTFDADDLFHWGDVLDATFIAAAGWTILNASALAAADLTEVRPSIYKDYDPGRRQFWLGYISGKVRAQTAYGAGTSFDYLDQNVALAAGRHVLGFGFDPSLTRPSRISLYVNGAAPATTLTSSGVDGTISDTTEPLRAGLWLGSYPGPLAQRALYIYNRPLTAQEHADNRTWIVNDGWA